MILSWTVKGKDFYPFSFCLCSERSPDMFVNGLLCEIWTTYAGLAGVG